MKPTQPGWWWCEYRGEKWMAEVYRAGGGNWAAQLHPLVPS